MSRRETDEHRKSDDVRSPFEGRTWGALAVLAFAAATRCRTADHQTRRPRARLEDIDRDRQLADERKLRADLAAAVRHAERSGNDELQRLIQRVDDDFTRLLERHKADAESRTVVMRVGANLTLAEVECRERGLLLDKP